MAELGSRLQCFLEDLDQSTEPRSESSVFDALRKLTEDDPEASTEEQAAFQAESMAFLFIEDYRSEVGAWGTYYGPCMVLRNREGGLSNVPDLGFVTQDVLAYWRTRAEVAHRPFLRLRYADLVWDLSKKSCGLTLDIRYARIAIDATLELISREDYKHKVDAIAKLKRALSLALSIGDEKRVIETRDAMVAFEDLIADDGMPGLWGFCLQTLAANKKVPLTSSQRMKLVEDMEARLERVSAADAGAFDPHVVEAAAMHLVRYYRRQQQGQEVHRVLRTMGQAYVSATGTAVPLVGALWLKQMFDLYYAEGMRGDAEALTPRLAELSKQAQDDMQPVSFEMQVPIQEMEAYLSALTEGSLHDVLTRLALHFLPDHEQVTNQVKEGAQKAPLQALISHALVDDEGRVVATVGSVDEDLGGRVIWQMSQNIGIGAVFLRQVLERLIAKFAPSTGVLLDYLYESPVFVPDARPLLRAGIDALLQGNHVVAAHILIPQIESAFRELMRLTDGAIYKPHRLGGLALKNLDDILHDERIRVVFGDDSVLYLRCLLTDPRGWNLRNNVCHGMAGVHSFGPTMSDRILHVLLLLAQLRSKPTADAEAAADEDDAENES